MGKIDVEHSNELDFQDGDCCVIITSDGDIRKIYMPDMDTKYFNSEGYAKLLECIDIIKPGTKEEFVKFHESERKGRIH